MARLKVSAKLLEAILFRDGIDVSIDGASFDPFTEVVTLEISGRDVPEAAEVDAIITEHDRMVRVRTVEFTALKAVEPA